MPLLATTTVLLLTLGALLALFGAAGSALNRHTHPDRESQAITRAFATAGRALLLAAVTITALRHTLPAQAVLGAAGIAALTITTRTPAPAGRHRATPT